MRLLRLPTLVALAIGVVACSSAAPSVPVTSINGSGPAVRSAAPPQAAPAAPPANGVAAPAQLEQSSSSAAPLLDRMVIRTARLSLQVADVERSLAEIRTIANDNGGYVGTSNSRQERSGDRDVLVADVTIQVRATALDVVVQALRSRAVKVESEQLGSQDVTEEYTDLQSNLRNLQSSEGAIVRLMDRATKIEDILNLQRELTNVRGQIERLEGRRRFLERRTDLATVTISLRTPPLPSEGPLSAWNPLATARRGWEASLGFLRSAGDLLILGLSTFWWLVILIAAGLAVRGVLLRRRVPHSPSA